MNATCVRWCIGVLVCCWALTAGVPEGRSQIGKEVAIPRHLQDGEEYQITIPQLIAFGEKLFTAKWTIQEGEGRPNIKGTAAGPPLSNPSEPLVFPRNFNRISGPDSNSCSGCHNEPVIGGGGDHVTDVFVLGQRFDFVTFNRSDTSFTQGAFDERGEPVTLQNIANERKTIGMNGSGFIEMLARQMTTDLQMIRNATKPGTDPGTCHERCFVWNALAPDGRHMGYVKRPGLASAEPCFGRLGPSAEPDYHAVPPSWCGDLVTAVHQQRIPATPRNAARGARWHRS